MRNTHSFSIANLAANALRTTLFASILLTSSAAFAQVNATKLDANKKQIQAKDKKVAAPATVKDGCNYSKNQVDEARGVVVKMMEREKLIKYTPAEMKAIFTDSDFITMEGYLNNFNNSIALLLKITIQTNSPRDTYGSIYKENKLLLKLANGESITLLSGQSDAGNVDMANIRTTYLTFFPLDDATMEKLKNNQVTKARLHWAKGYEDYDIAIPDFFVRQLSCVK